MPIKVMLSANMNYINRPSVIRMVHFCFMAMANYTRGYMDTTIFAILARVSPSYHIGRVAVSTPSLLKPLIRAATFRAALLAIWAFAKAHIAMLPALIAIAHLMSTIRGGFGGLGRLAGLGTFQTPGSRPLRPLCPIDLAYRAISRGKIPYRTASGFAAVKPSVK